MIVFFRRSIGVDPLASYLKVYASGEGIATVVYGGRNGARVHHFVLDGRAMQRLERLLSRTRLHTSAMLNPRQYTYWIITGHGAHRLQQGAIPHSAQPLIAALNAIADANHLD